MRGHRRVWVAVGSTLAGFVLVGTAVQPALASTATLVNESFTGSSTTSANWVKPAATDSGGTNDACLTAGDGSGPVPGCGDTAGSQAGLQLTTNLQSQEGGLVYDSSVPSSLGLDVTFDSYQYDSSVNGPAERDCLLPSRL